MIIENYTFASSSQTVTFTDLAIVKVEGIKLITNLANGTIIYQFNNAAKLGVVTNNVLNLTFDTTSMSDSDPLMIIYDDITLPSSDASLAILADMVLALKQIRKTLEPVASQDSVQRQRVVVESLTGATVAVSSIAANTMLGTTNVANTNVITQGAQAPTVGSNTFQPVWEGPVDQRYRVSDAARAMAYQQRQNLIFS